MMSLPNGAVAFRRPPAETRPALTESDQVAAAQAENSIPCVRSKMSSHLDFTAAESDWKAFVDNSPTRLKLNLRSPISITAASGRPTRSGILSLVAAAPATAAEKLSPPSQQRSWQAFERIFEIIQAQGLAEQIYRSAQYRAWIKRYPGEPIAVRSLHGVSRRAKRLFGGDCANRRLSQAISG